MARLNLIYRCNYCGEDIPKKHRYEREEVASLEAYYHLDCFYRAKEEQKLLQQLKPATFPWGGRW
jgi:hypothetical protein